MSSEEKFPVKTSNWSDEIENMLKDLGESCLGYKWMNIMAAKKNELRYNILMYTSIIIGPIAGVLSSVINAERNEDIDYLSTIQILVTIFSFLNGVVSAIIKFSEFGEKSASFKSTAVKYATIESNIRRQLSLSREERVNPGDYIEWISKTYDDVFSSSPLIDYKIYEEWVEIAKKSNMHIPKELPQLKIHTNDPETATISDGRIRYELARMFRSV